MSHATDEYDRPLWTVDDVQAGTSAWRRRFGNSANHMCDEALMAGIVQAVLDAVSPGIAHRATEFLKEPMWAFDLRRKALNERDAALAEVEKLRAAAVAIERDRDSSSAWSEEFKNGMTRAAWIVRGGEAA